MDSNFRSQYDQDRIALSLLGDLDKGFFVELGAGDGIYLSNTYYFEKVLGWGGLLVEPNPFLYERLVNNRNCYLSSGLCSGVDGDEVEFLLSGELSGIISNESGYWVRYNMDKDRIRLTTTMLSRILDEFNVPESIDFLSLDVEGSEYGILSTFPFDRYRVRLICVEHNAPWDGDMNKVRIGKLLLDRGYRLVREIRLDDFYMI